MSGSTEKNLNSLQLWFLSLVLQVGPGAPLASLLWDFGMLDMGLRVWMEKIMLALHIIRLDDRSLAGKVYKEQKLNKWPCIAQEVDDICQKLSVQNVNSMKLSAKAYRREVEEACHKVNEERLRKQAEGKTKC